MSDRLIEFPIDDAILILKEEHKQRVDGYTTHLSYGGKGDPAEEVSLDALEMAISALEQTKWISVKDRLPDTDDWVLVCKKTIETGYTSMAVDRCSMTVGGDRMWLAEYATWKQVVSHWMPLPQPPKGA